ncbi:hypothetical protein X797_012171 [Metarhizium robertsii]|nr:hypothetical protein X797_012171 [Metarhizium robertsii]
MGVGQGLLPNAFTMVKQLHLGGADLTIQNHHGKTPLQSALVGKDYTELSRSILEAIVDYLSRAPKWGSNQLDQDAIRAAHKQDLITAAIRRQASFSMNTPPSNADFEDFEEDDEEEHTTDDECGGRA